MKAFPIFDFQLPIHSQRIYAIIGNRQWAIGNPNQRGNITYHEHRY